MKLDLGILVEGSMIPRAPRTAPQQNKLNVVRHCHPNLQNLRVSYFSRLTVTNRSQTFGEPPSPLTHIFTSTRERRAQADAATPDGRQGFSISHYLHAWRCGCRFVLVPLVRSFLERLSKRQRVDRGLVHRW